MNVDQLILNAVQRQKTQNGPPHVEETPAAGPPPAPCPFPDMLRRHRNHGVRLWCQERERPETDPTNAVS